MEPQTVPQRFAQQVRLRPDAVALSSDAERLTFAELDEATDDLAGAILSRCGDGAGRVALLAAHDAAACVAAVSVVKAGKTLVVLNPRDPAAGLDLIRRDAEPELVVVDPRYRELAVAAGFPATDAISFDASDSVPEVLPESHPQDLVSLVYTSGSTGRPKAVMLPHRAVLQHIICQGNTLGLKADSRVGLLAPLSTSWGLSTLWTSTLSGVSACLFSLAEHGMGRLPEWLQQEEVTEVALATSVFRNVARTVTGRLDRVRQVQLGGETTRRSDFDAFWHCFPETSVMVNSLGSTECGALTRHLLSANMDPPPGVLPVGRACEGFEVLILDEAGREVPSGEVGEIAVRSDYLPPGYWRDAELTAERLTPDPAGSGRLYHTRDLGRISEQGLLTVVGRRDFRVKVRGHMVDLDDVESALAALPEVGAAAVHAGSTPRGDTRLTAFVALRPDAEKTTAELRCALGSTLSAAAVPAAFRYLDSLPLTPQGKVDRQALARLEPEPAPAYRVDDQPPADEIETQIAEIWSGAFELDGLDRHADFFELGGDSLISAVIAAMVDYTFGVELELRTVIDSPTVAEMAETVRRLVGEHAAPARPPLTPTSGDEPLRLSFAEERTWNESRTEEASARYTFAAGRRIEGELDVAALRSALDHVVRRHEILRTSFTERRGKPVRVVHPPEPVDLPLIDVSQAADPHTAADDVLVEAARVTFDLERAPLLWWRLVRTAPTDHHLVWAVHHVVSDEWSWKVFLDELRVLYQAFNAGRPAPLPDTLPAQYGHFAAWQRRWLDPSSETFRGETAWWRNALHDATPLARLPFARASRCPDARPSDGVVLWGVPPEVSRRLDRLGRTAGATFFMTRLGLFAVHLVLETGQEDVVLGTYATGRRHAATQAMIGFFSNPVTLRLHLSPDISFREALARARACVLEASAHSEVPYGPLSEALAAQGVTVPPIQVIFGVTDQPPLRFSGLELSTFEPHVETMPWQFTFTVDKHKEDRACTASFDAHIHDPEQVRGFVARYRRLAAQLCEDPDRPVGEGLARR